MIKGTIIKGYSGFYYVDTGNDVIACSLRGKNRLIKTDFFPGDKVEIEIIDQEKKVGVIDKISKRKNFLVRPPIANIDQVIITSAMKDPTPDFMLIDRLSVLAAIQWIYPVLVFNKTDLSEPGQEEIIRQIYKEAEFPLLFVSADEEKTKNEVRSELKKLLENKITIVAGISGVGKTSLINLLEIGEMHKVGEVSRKLKRGKHTTRHTELLQIGKESWVADSPGFSSLEFPDDVSAEEIPKAYPEFRKYDHLCKFNNCFHLKEPDCEIKRQLEAGVISKSRYNNYKYFIDEIRNRKERRY